MAKKFILVDDDKDDRMLFCLALEAVNKDAICVVLENGCALIETLHQDINQLPDLIFLDINMPVKDGFYFLDLLKQDNVLKGIPVIMYSTSGIQTEIERAKRCGALCLLTKPNYMEDLQYCLELVYTKLLDGSLAEIDQAQCNWFHQKV